MSILLKYSLIILILFFNLSFLCAQYSISGQLIDSEQKYERIALELVPSINGLWSTDSDNIINSTHIDSLGNFTLAGNDLPLESSLYRLSLLKKGVSTSLKTGPNKTNLHLILNNHSQLVINSCEDVSNIFGFCEILGSKESSIVQVLYDDIIYGFYDDYRAMIETDTKLKEELVHQKHTKILKNYCDTSTHLIPSLIAYKHIKTEFDPEYITKSGFYSSYMDKLNRMDDSSPFVNEIKHELYPEKDGHTSSLYIYLSFILSFLLLLLGLYTLSLRRKLKKFEKAVRSSFPLQDKIKSLSKKEIEVFQHIKEGKSNKEIASILFIEVNTVKSHISKIYQKLDIKSRKEALDLG